MMKKFKVLQSWMICLAVMIITLNMPVFTNIVKAEALKEVENIHWGDTSKGEIETSVYWDPVQGADRYVVEYSYEMGGGTRESTTNCIDLKKSILMGGKDAPTTVKKVDAYIGQIHLATANVEISKQFDFDQIPTPIVTLNKHDKNDSQYWDITWNFHKKSTYYMFMVVEDFEVDTLGNITFSKMITNFAQNYNDEDSCKVDFSSFSNEIKPGKVYGFIVKAYYGPDDEFASDDGYYEYVAEKGAINNITWTESKGSSSPVVKLSWSKVSNVDTYIIYDYKKDVLTSSGKNEIDMTKYIDFEDMSKNQFYIRAYRGATEYSVLSAAPTFDYGINVDFNKTEVIYNTGDEPEELIFAAHDSCHGGITEYQVHSIIGGVDRIINSKSYKTTTVTRNDVEEKMITIQPDTSIGRTTEYYVTYFCPKHPMVRTESNHITVTVHDIFSITSNSGDAQIYQGSNAAASLDVNGTGVSCAWTVDGVDVCGKQNGKTFYLDTLSTLEVGEHNIVATVTDIMGQTLTQNYKITVLESNANHVPMKILKSRVNGYLSKDNPVINLVDVKEIAFTYEWQTDGYAADTIPVIGTISYDWDFYPIKEDGSPDLDHCSLSVEDKDKITSADLSSLQPGEYAVLSSVWNTITVNGKEKSSMGIVSFKLNTTSHSHTFNTGYAPVNDTYHNAYCECGGTNQEKHNWDPALTVEASYYNEGKKVCMDCGYIYVIPQIDCNNHSYNLICDSDGHYNRCVLCGYETTHIAHQRSTLESDIIEEGKAATCTTPGITAVVRCADCPYCFQAEKIPAKGHDFTKYVSIGNGKHKIVCKNCDEVKVGHDADACSGGKATCTKKAKCTKCGEEYGDLAEHTLKTTTTKATLTENGKKETKCSVCSKVTKTTKIYAAKTIKLSKTTYAYDGKAKKPTVTVKDSKDKAIATSNYTVTYDDGRKNVGKYNVKITFKGDYKGSKTLTFTINPKAITLKTVTPASKAFTATWSKQTTQVDGYELQYALDDKFTSSAKKVEVNKNTTTSKKISSLKSKKTYYVRVRTYKKVGTKKYYSDWSKVLSVKTK